jgi:hypothetical protein
MVYPSNDDQFAQHKYGGCNVLGVTDVDVELGSFDVLALLVGCASVGSDMVTGSELPQE